MSTLRTWSIIFSLTIAGCSEDNGQTQSKVTPVVRVFADRYEINGNVYGSVVELETFLEANPNLVLGVSVSDCASSEQTAQFFKLLRERAQHNLFFSTFPEGCQ